ncbi:MAG: hypothetical protein RBU37_03660 [Myxococcota bacterium]|nr:hypothetical protein [Myxococcota bacterium]
MSIRAFSLACALITALPMPLLAQEQPTAERQREAEDIAQRCQHVIANMSFRGLAPLNDIACGYLTRDQLYQRMLEQLAEESSAEQLADDALLLSHLGLLSPRLDYHAFIVDLLAEQVIGLYDHNSKELFLVEGQTLASVEEVMSHELFHAIQDQYFGIDALRAGGDDNTDLLAARMALIEGDAFAVLFDYALPFGLSFTDLPSLEESVRGAMDSAGQAMDQGKLAEAPLHLKQSLLFPYLDGLFFIAAVKRAGGWPAVDQVYADPPSSTEQILHPERYLERDEPTLVSFELPSSFSTSGRLVDDNVFGELSCRLYFEQHAVEQGLALEVNDACEGWEGDRSIAWAWDAPDHPLSPFVFIQLSNWENAEDAAQFVNAHLRTWQARFPELS